MSMVKESAQIIQAFPIGPHTYSGLPSNFDIRGFNIIHAAEDGDITFNFGTQGSVTITVLAGQDLAIHPDTVSITATGQVWIS